MRKIAIFLVMAMGTVSAITAAPASATVATGHGVHPFAFSLSPVVGVRTTGGDSCSVGPVSGTNCAQTIVLNGSGLPTADPSTIGVEVSDNTSIVTVEDNNDGSSGWLAGHDTDTFTTCKVIVGASSSTQMILSVGDLGPTCPGYSMQPGDSIKVILYTSASSGTVYDTETTTALTPGTTPLVSDVNPPYGPVAGGTNDAPGTGSVTVTTSDVGTPEAMWFGVVATSNITPVDATHFSVVPPPSPAGQDNEGIALQVADPANGTSPQHCAVLLPTGCADQYMYLSQHSDTFSSPPLNFNWSASLGGQASIESKACGINGSSGTSTGLSIGGSVTGGPLDLAAGYGVSESALAVPETLVGSATLTVEHPINISISLTGSVSGCEQIPIPDLAIPDVAGLYFVVGGSISASVTLTITINQGTYSLSGGYIPGSNADDIRGVTMKTDCVDGDGNPTTDCVTTAFSANMTGTLAVSPLWLQIGPSFANVGAGLTAAAIGTITYPPLAVDGDICVAGNWVAQVNVGPLSGNTGGSWLGPFNIFGNGSLCPLGSAGSTPTATSTDLQSSANPSAPGDQVTYTATVAPTPDGGTVEFDDAGTPIAGCEAVAVDGGGAATCPVTYPGEGLHKVVATYSGDAAFGGSSSPEVDQQVSSTPVPTATTTDLQSSANPSALSQLVTYTATVSPTPDGGTVSFTDGGGAIASCQSVAVDGFGQATCGVTYGSAANHNIVATFSGDTGFDGSTSTTLKQTVSASVTPTSTALVSSVNPSVSGNPVTFTATVSPTPDGGTVSFSDGGGAIASCQSVALTSNHAACVLTFTNAGSHSIVATYSGDASFAGSAASAVVQKVKSSGGFEAAATPTTTTYGHGVTLSVTGLPAGAKGAVTFKSGTVTLCAATIKKKAASCATPSNLLPAAYPVTATYAGPPIVTAPTSFTISKATLYIAAVAKPKSVVYGHSSFLSVTGLPAGATGAIKFVAGKTTLCLSPTTGTPGCATSKKLAAGTYKITATYPGNAKYDVATAKTSLAVTKLVFKMTAKATPATVKKGKAVTLEALGIPLGATGTVTFTSGSATLCVATVKPKGAVFCSTSKTLAVGTYAVTGNYSGNAAYKPETATTSFKVTK